MRWSKYVCFELGVRVEEEVEVRDNSSAPILRNQSIIANKKKIRNISVDLQ